MFNSSGITKKTGAGPNQILAFTETMVAIGVTLNANIVSAADSDGRKIAKAGTPITGNLNARTTAFTAAVTAESTSNAVGILLHDVDVTGGNANAVCLIFGFVNTNRLDTATSALITAEVKTALNAKVTFLAV